MHIYLDKRRIAFIFLSFLSFLFSLICTFSTGWSTSKQDNFGLFSPDITTNNICGRVTKDDKNCLGKCTCIFVHNLVFICDFRPIDHGKYLLNDLTLDELMMLTTT